MTEARTPRRVVYYVEGGTFAGTERHLCALVAHLDRSRFDPVVLGVMHDLLEEEMQKLSVPVVRLAPVRSKFDIPAWLGVVAAVRRARPVIFHGMLSQTFAGSYALLTAVTMRVPAVVVTNHLPTPAANRRQAWLRRRLDLGVDLQIVLSAWARQQLAEAGMLARRVAVVDGGLTPPMWRDRADARRVLDLPEDATVVGTAMRMEPYKRPDLVADLVRLPGVHVAIFGDGPERSRLAAAGSPRLHLYGFRPDAPELLRALDVFVFPSTYENQPLAVIEAMWAGVPVVGADEGGVAELIEHGRTGILAPATAALSDAVAELLADPERRRALGEAAATEAARRFDPAGLAERIQRLYEDLLGNGRETLGSDRRRRPSRFYLAARLAARRGASAAAVAFTR
ncbi:MAG TPA: glycosyltransferase family 4 protein [Acidimicrobiales bacterium]|nr:glycosyltransferase family 4 protein [Acidimicrobiales bacterium]